jgi:hypothetical protein
MSDEPLNNEPGGANVHEIAQPNALERMMAVQVVCSKGLVLRLQRCNDEIISDFFLINLYKGKKLLSLHDGGAMESMAEYHSKKDQRRKAKAALILVGRLFL